MKVIYVAGKLTGMDNFEISRNVRAAEDVGMAVAVAGASPMIPHTNTGLIFFGTCSAQFWYDATLALMRRCEAVILVPGWEESKGTQGELVEAKRLGLPVFYNVTELSAWLGDGPAFDRAVRLLGINAVIGRNEQYGAAPFHVGAKAQGEWTHFGAGTSYEEAFANVKKVIKQKADQSFVYEGDSDGNNG